jgi:hypothetical protein
VFLDKTVQNPNEHVQQCVIELVFNLEEVGISDCEKRTTRKVLASSTMRGQTRHHGISRIVKDILVIAYVSTAGESLIVDDIPTVFC